MGEVPIKRFSFQWRLWIAKLSGKAYTIDMLRRARW